MPSNEGHNPTPVPTLPPMTTKAIKSRKWYTVVQRTIVRLRLIPNIGSRNPVPVHRNKICTTDHTSIAGPPCLLHYKGQTSKTEDQPDDHGATSGIAVAPLHPTDIV